MGGCDLFRKKDLLLGAILLFIFYGQLLCGIFLVGGILGRLGQGVSQGSRKAYFIFLVKGIRPVSRLGNDRRAIIRRSRSRALVH
jgi:hypothetical protein